MVVQIQLFPVSHNNRAEMANSWDHSYYAAFYFYLISSNQLVDKNSSTIVKNNIIPAYVTKERIFQNNYESDPGAVHQLSTP